MTRLAPHLPPDFAAAAGANGQAQRDDTPRVGVRLDPAALLDLGREPIPWTLDRFAARGYLTVLASRGGEGKSLFTLAAASATEAGGACGGIPATAATAAVWDAENGPPLLGRRLHLLGPDATFPALYDASTVRLTDPATIDALAAEIAAEGYQLVILDALRTLAPDIEESNGDEMAPLVVAVKQLARTTLAAIVLIVHRDKALAHDYRGSSVLHDQADLVFVLEREKDDPLRWRRRLRCSKARICEEPDDRWLGLRVHHGELTITEAAPFEPPAVRGPAVRDGLADELLEVLREDGGRLTRSELARRVERSRSDNTVRRALDDLADQGLIDRDDEAGGWGVAPTHGPPATPSTESPCSTGGSTPVGGAPGDYTPGAGCSTPPDDSETERPG